MTTRSARSLALSALSGAFSMIYGNMSSAEELRVVATIKPIHSLVAAVMQGVGTPALLVDGQASPHSFSLRPSDAKALNTADVVFRISGALEPFTVKIAEALPKSVQLVDLETAPGVSLLDMRTGTTFVKHEHDGKASAKKDHDHDHDKDHAKGSGKKTAVEEHDHDEDDHAHGGKDGHIWLDPENAKAIVRHAASVLGARRPDLKAQLEVNAENAIGAIDALDKELIASLAAAKDKPFVVFHDAYQYFEKRYGLTAVGSITLNPEVKPSARRLKDIRAKLAKTKAACVFAEPQFSPKIIATVTEGSKAKSGTLDPLGSAVPSGVEHYGAMMRALAHAMTACLGQ